MAEETYIPPPNESQGSASGSSSEGGGSSCFGQPSPITDDIYTQLQIDMEIYRPFIWLAFFVSKPQNNNEYEAFALDHCDFGNTNRFKYMKGFEHKLFGNQGEAVMVKFYDEGAFKMPSILKAILFNLCKPKEGGLENQVKADNYLAFQYGYHSPALYGGRAGENANLSGDEDEAKKIGSQGIKWCSQERLLAVTKVDIAFDEGGTSYVVHGIDPCAAIQQSVPMHQIPVDILIHEAFKQVLTAYGLELCIDQSYQQMLAKLGPADFTISAKMETGERDALAWMLQICNSYSKQGEFALGITYNSISPLSGATDLSDQQGSSGKGKVVLFCQDIKKAYQMTQDGGQSSSAQPLSTENLMPGMKSSLIVNAFEKAKRGGVVINFKPMINFVAAASMQVMFNAIDPHVRATDASQGATEGKPDQKNYIPNQGIRAALASNALEDAQSTLQSAKNWTEKFENDIRQVGDIAIAGMEAELECLGMPLYDDRVFLCDSNKRYINLDVRMPYFLDMGSAYDDNLEWVSSTLGATEGGGVRTIAMGPGAVGANGMANRNKVLSGYWFVKDISHRIDENMGYTTTYTITRMVPPGGDFASSYGGAGTGAPGASS